MRFTAFLRGSVAVLAFIAAWGPLPVNAKIQVIASFSIIGDIASNIGKERIELRTIVGPDSDAHVYKPSPADAIALSKADVILINGLQLEDFIKRLVAASETSAQIIEVTQGANIIQDPAGGHYHFYDGKAVFHAAPFNPHAWQSIANACVYVKNIADAFYMADKTGCDSYRANAEISV